MRGRHGDEAGECARARWQCGSHPRNATAPPRAALPEVKADKHPEYVADEFLEIRQGVGVPYAYDDETKKGGGTQETKVAGKYGSYGWTEREGFAKSVDPKREE